MASLNSNKQNVEVFIRFRKPVDNEPQTKFLKVDQDCIYVRSGQSADNKYQFDGILTPNFSQSSVYKIIIEPQLPRLLKGHNCTFFTYGPAGTGKTYTIFGDANETGLIERVSVDLFQILYEKMKKSKISDCTMFVSAVEIYNENLRDLSYKDGKLLQLYNDPNSKNAACVKYLTENYVSSDKDVTNFIKKCLGHCTPNSHKIFTFTIKFREITVKGEEIITISKLTLLDLASNDIKSKSMQNLINVMQAIVGKQSHIPYRDSKLTRILQDSLGGESYATLIATMSQGCNKESVMNTLEFAHLARNIENTPKINVRVSQDDTIKQLVEQGSKLKRDLEAARRGEGFYITKASYDELEKENQHKGKALKEHKDRCENLRQEIQNHIAELHKKKILLHEETKRINDQKEKLEMESKKFRCLNKTKDELLDLFRTISQQEEIYHNKYQKQINGTVYNADLAKKLYHKNLEATKQLGRTTKQFGDDSLKNVAKIEQVMEEIKAKQLSFWTFMRTHIESYKKHFDIEKTKSWTSVKENMHQLVLDNHTEILDELKENLIDYENHVLANSVKLNVQKETTKQEFARKIKILQKLNEAHTQRDQHIKESDLKNDGIKALITRYQDLSETNNKKVEINIETTNPATFLKSFNGISEKLDRHRDELIEARNCAKIIVDQAKSELDTKHIENLNHLATYIDHHLHEVEEDIEEHTMFIASEIDKDSKSAIEKHENIAGFLEDIKTYTSKYISDFNVFVEQSQNDVEMLAKELDTQVHEGDTPVKRNCDIPDNCNVSFSEFE